MLLTVRYKIFYERSSFGVRARDIILATGPRLSIAFPRPPRMLAALRPCVLSRRTMRLLFVALSLGLVAPALAHSLSAQADGTSLSAGPALRGRAGLVLAENPRASIQRLNPLAG